MIMTMTKMCSIVNLAKTKNCFAKPEVAESARVTGPVRMSKSKRKSSVFLWNHGMQNL